MLLALSGCENPQRRDFENLCYAHQRAGVKATDNSGERAMKIAGYLGSTLQTREAKRLLEQLPNLPVAQKALALTEAAAKYGVKPCPLAEATWPSSSSDAGR